MKNSGLPGLPKRTFLSPSAQGEMEFTALIPFTVDRETKNRIAGTPGKIPGMYLASLGDNWELYLNGNLLRSEMYLNDRGRILTHRFLRDIFFPIPPEFFAEGENILSFRILGDPADRTTGFLYTSPYYIGEYGEILAGKNEALPLALIGIFLYIGIYYLTVFINRREARYYLFFGLLSLTFAVYYLTRSWAIYLLIPDTAICTGLELLSLFFVLPLAGAFMENIALNKTCLVTKIYGGFFAFLGLIQLFFPHAFASDVLLLWQSCALGVVLIIIVFDFGYLFFISARDLKKRLAGEGRRVSPLGIAGKTLTGTITGNLVLCGFFSAATGLFDVIDAMFFHTWLMLSRYGFFIFTGAMGLILSRQFGELFNELSRAKSSLEQANVNLEETVRKRTAELEIQTRRAESASRAKSEFLAKMSHEIRTPLNAVIGLTEIELRKKPRGETGENLGEIRHSGSILLSLINDLLDISKIEAGKQELKLAEYDPLRLLGECIRVNVVRIGSKPVEFRAEIDETLPKTLIGDEGRIKQILNNLLSNGIKYTDRGKVSLRVRCEREAEGCALTFVVEDTGRGIKEENLENLFLEYRRVDEQLNQGIEGTGLGLSITRKLTEMMDGRIEAASVFGQGSAFTVTIRQKIGDGEPVGKKAAESLASPAFRQPREEGGEEEFVQLPQVSVLVVDDVFANLKVAQGLFRPYGMNVALAKSGEQAIAILRETDTRFDAIFMDQMMPGMDGVEAVRIIREEIGGYLKTVPVIAMTANALVGSEQMFLEKGFQDYLPKPVSAGKLDGIIRKWLIK
jgi:signal transduction histidine kinase/CheY-like chemotaxis protein